MQHPSYCTASTYMHFVVGAFQIGAFFHCLAIAQFQREKKAYLLWSDLIHNPHGKCETFYCMEEEIFIHEPRSDFCCTPGVDMCCSYVVVCSEGEGERGESFCCRNSCLFHAGLPLCSKNGLPAVAAIPQQYMQAAKKGSKNPPPSLAGTLFLPHLALPVGLACRWGNGIFSSSSSAHPILSSALSFCQRPSLPPLRPTVAPSSNFPLDVRSSDLSSPAIFTVPLTGNGGAAVYTKANRLQTMKEERGVVAKKAVGRLFVLVVVAAKVGFYGKRGRQKGGGGRGMNF